MDADDLTDLIESPDENWKASSKYRISLFLSTLMMQVSKANALVFYFQDAGPKEKTVANPGNLKTVRFMFQPRSGRVRVITEMLPEEE